ncbi:MAG: hypothetical protein NVS9B3_14720 [Gemmatimonadaceae bacterium]
MARRWFGLGTPGMFAAERGSVNAIRGGTPVAARRDSLLLAAARLDFGIVGAHRSRAP